MLELENVECLVDAHGHCEECLTCRILHPKTSAACPGQTGQFSQFTCETIRRDFKKAENIIH